MMSALPALRELIERRFPDAVPVVHQTAPAVATGIAELDRIFPGEGIPRARLTVWRPFGAATALLTCACRQAVATAERAVWVDGGHTINGESWVSGPLLLRPHDRRNALRATEEMLRCGGFSLVVLAGVEPHPKETVRLSRAVREGGGAFVVLTSQTAMAHLRVVSRVVPKDYRWRENPFGDPALTDNVLVRVSAQSLGWTAATVVTIPVWHPAARMALDAGVVDRRGTTAGRSRSGRTKRGERP
ncbi:hypothetical protein BH23GEM2_BH23GEM2_17540 [soil metagenome]